MQLRCYCPTMPEYVNTFTVRTARYMLLEACSKFAKHSQYRSSCLKEIKRAICNAQLDKDREAAFICGTEPFLQGGNNEVPVASPQYGVL